MSEYTFRNIRELDITGDLPDVLATGVHIILFNPTTPPPHLLILVNGAIYSLAVSGPRVNWALSELLAMLLNRKIPTLFISLREPKSLVVSDRSIKEYIHDLTVIHPGVRANEASCLFPIMEFCKTVYNIDISKVRVIFDLLDQLEKENVVHKRWHVNMSERIKNGEFQIARYGEDEVNQMIQNLTN